MLWTPKYYQIDVHKAVAYPEQFVGLQYLPDSSLPDQGSVYGVSMAITDPAPLFDAHKSFRENVADITCTGKHRGRRYKGGDLQAFFAAGMHIRYDQYLDEHHGVPLPVLCFNFTVDMAADDRALNDRLSSVVMTREKCHVSGVYSFKDFSKQEEDFHENPDMRCRIYTAQGFAEDLSNVPFVYRMCRRHVHDTNDPCLGDLYAASVSCMTKSALSVYGKDLAPLLIHSNKRNDKKQIVENTVTTLEEYAVAKNKIGAIRATAPLRDPAAAYNILQLGRLIDGKYPEGAREARKAACFLTEQMKTYTLC